MKAIQMRRDGMSFANIAKVLGRSTDTVYAWLNSSEGGTSIYGKCALCGVEFISHNAKRKFCTEQHQGKYHKAFGPLSRIL